MTANVGGKPEPVKAERDEFESGAAFHQPTEFIAVTGKRQGSRERGWRWRWM
jgi:hypothetical protein